MAVDINSLLAAMICEVDKEKVRLFKLIPGDNNAGISIDPDTSIEDALNIISYMKADVKYKKLKAILNGPLENEDTATFFSRVLSK